MKKEIIIALIILFFATAPTLARAETLKGGYGACASEELFSQLVTAISKKDELAFRYLLDHGCVITKEGIQVSVLDRSWGRAKIRAYVGNEAVVLWTYTENIRE